MTNKRRPRVYIAGKFRGPTNAAIQRNIDISTWFQAPIAAAGAMPINVHSMEGLRLHDIQQQDNGQFWLDVTMDELRTCDAMVLVPGWQTSVGSYYEAVEALYSGLPVFEAQWDTSFSFKGAPEPASPYEWLQVETIAGKPGLAAAYLRPQGTFAEWLIGQLAEVTT